MRVRSFGGDRGRLPFEARIVTGAMGLRSLVVCSPPLALPKVNPLEVVAACRRLAEDRRRMGEDGAARSSGGLRRRREPATRSRRWWCRRLLARWWSSRRPASSASRSRARGASLIPLAKGGRVTVRFEGGAASLHAAKIVTAPGRGGPAQPRRVLLVVIDTLRDDAVSASSMPELIDAFAGGTRFTRAYSPASWTLPAMASMLTGQAPHRARFTRWHADRAGAGRVDHRVRLRRARLLHRRHLGQLHGATTRTASRRDASSSWCRRCSVTATGRTPSGCSSARGGSLDWFPERDLFLYLHLMDPHDPYREREDRRVVAGALDRPDRRRRNRATDARRLRRRGRATPARGSPRSCARRVRSSASSSPPITAKSSSSTAVGATARPCIPR